MEEEKGEIPKDTIDSNLKTTFAVFVIFVLMAAVAVVFLGIEVHTQQESSQEKQQQGTDIESPTSKLTGLVEDLENQGSSFLEKTKTATTDESQEEPQESELNPFSELNCNKLADIASSFEDGWAGHWQNLVPDAREMMMMK